jgi:hypothetical protein
LLLSFTRLYANSFQTGKSIFMWHDILNKLNLKKIKSLIGRFEYWF